ncbi:hypothetical protein A2U01_0119487, partial [Trifolium medium]|nr:hypothetical protein [Trifolium medium]
QQEPPMYNDQNNNDDGEPSPLPFEKNTSESNSVLAKIDEQYRAKQENREPPRRQKKQPP